MGFEMQLLVLLLMTWAQLTTQTVLDKASSTRILHATSIIIGLPAITTTSTSVCNVQASIPEEFQERHSQGAFDEFTPMACLYRCLITTPCYSWSWNSSAAALNNSNCMMWSADVGDFTPSNTSQVFFSVRDGCIGVVPAYNRNISAPFYGEDGLFINRAVYDCGIEGTATAEYESYNEYSFNYSSIATCQDECDTEDGCISYSYDYGAKNGNCRMYYQWIAGRIVVGNTGVFFSDASRKTGYKCFATKAFGS
jgi:hypothetical protein